MANFSLNATSVSKACATISRTLYELLNMGSITAAGPWAAIWMVLGVADEGRLVAEPNAVPSEARITVRGMRNLTTLKKRDIEHLLLVHNGTWHPYWPHRAYR
jgi:hypothetical protein